MTTSFNTIPSNTLVPLFYAEMDNQAANTAQDSGASLLIGHANTRTATSPIPKIWEKSLSARPSQLMWWEMTALTSAIA